MLKRVGLSAAQDFFFLNRWIMKFAGLWLPDSQNPNVQTAYKIYAVFVFVFVNLYFTATEFVSLLYTYKDLNEFIKNINFALTHLMGAVKVVFWYFNGYKMQRIIKVLEEADYYEESGQFKPKELYDDFRILGMKTTIVFFLFAHSTLSASYLPPTFIALKYLFADSWEGLPENLPYYCWMPFAYDTPKLYLLALGYQAGPMFSYAYSIVGMDTLIMNILNFISYHLSLIQRAFLTIAERTLEDPCRSKLTKEEDEMINREAVKICKHVQVIRRICMELEATQRYLTFCQGMATLFILCTCLYLVSTTPVFSEEFYAEVIYFVAMGFQVFLYCWFGNEVTLKAQEVPMYIWRSNWYATNKKFKETMVYTMLIMKRSIYFSFGNFVPLTLQTFMNILKTSYSFFAVINNSEK